MDVRSLTAEARSGLSPAEVAEALINLAPELAPTADEQARRDAAWKLADAATWRAICQGWIKPILASYENLEIDLDDALDIMERASIGCLPQYRMYFYGILVAVARRMPREARATRSRGHGKPQYPSCIKNLTADLALLRKEREPDLRRTPGVSNRQTSDPSSPIIRETLEILEILQWFGDEPTPQPATVDEWIRQRLHELNQPVRVGRPRRNS